MWPSSGWPGSSRRDHAERSVEDRPEPTNGNQILVLSVSTRSGCRCAWQFGRGIAHCGDVAPAAAREHADAALMIGSPLTYDERDQIGSLTRKNSLPATGTAVDFAV